MGGKSAWSNKKYLHLLLHVIYLDFFLSLPQFSWDFVFFREMFIYTYFLIQKMEIIFVVLHHSVDVIRSNYEFSFSYHEYIFFAGYRYLILSFKFRFHQMIICKINNEDAWNKQCVLKIILLRHSCITSGIRNEKIRFMSHNCVLLLAYNFSWKSNIHINPCRINKYILYINIISFWIPCKR